MCPKKKPTMEALMDSARRSGRILNKQNLSAIMICAIGIAVNTLLNALVTAFGIPLYLDTIGTIVVSAMGGVLPGVVVGFATGIIKSIFSPASLYYGVLNVLIAVAAAFLARRGWFEKIRGIIGSIFVFVLIGGGIGSLIPLFMQDLTFDSESLSGIIYGTGLFNLPVSNILSSLIMDLPDKAITVLIAVAILKIVPGRYYSLSRFEIWAQKPVDHEKISEKSGVAKQRISLKTKIMLIFGSSMGVLSVVAGYVGISVYQNAITEEYVRIAKGTAEIAAGIVDGDSVDEWLSNGGKGEGYMRTKQMLASVLSSSVDIEYLYVYKIKEDGCHVVFDFDVLDTAGDTVGTVISFDEGFMKYLPDLLAGREIEPIITNDKYGHLLTAYDPVYDSNGECVCYAGADVDMGTISFMTRSFLVEMIAVFSSFFILMAAIVVWITDYRVTFPLNSITRAVEDYTTAKDDQKDLDKKVRSIRSLEIRTGDEVERLYKAICLMASTNAEQMRSIRRLSDTTAKMQDGLIITMADMVENRDSDTGAHIQKTAAYVKIIVEGLKKKGYYAEKITPKFMSDVVRSAPLHDVGKIDIPDKILNKPGKLTDEEYEIMKTHTTAGKRIIENAISITQGDNYLKEARNMAAYHHERWDGKGYPEKLHGEVIPLSARIMAVADVFDALTSPRIYKPGFPLEKSLSIINEGSGTQFDPRCVEVFMDSLEDVKKILRKYNPEALG